LTIIVGALLYGALTLCFLTLPRHPSQELVLLLYGALGIPFAGIQVGPFAQIAHLAFASAQASGKRQEGIFTGLWTAGEKLGLALGPGVAGLALAYIGFQQGHALQTEPVSAGLTTALACAPTVFFVLSTLFLTGRELAVDGSEPDSTFAPTAGAQAPD
jgi:Na+/melibiose symporter-like transporter